MLEIVLTLEILGPPEIGGPRLKPFQLNGKSAPGSMPGVANQSETKSLISYTVLPQRATSYTWAHMYNTPSLHYSHTYPYSAGFIVNITHQHDNDRTLHVI